MSNYQYKVNGVDYNVEIEDIEGNIAKVTVNGKPFEVELKEPVKKPMQRKLPPSPKPPSAVAPKCWHRCQALSPR